MALPSSGALTFSAIGAALCTPQSAPYSLRAMSSAAGFTTPDSVSEFYGYSCPTTTTTTTAASYTIAGFVYAGTTVTCGTTTGKTFVYLNATDYATYSGNGNVLTAGMKFFRDSSGTTWDTATKPKGNDPVALNIWNCNSTGITVFQVC
jgi:hypothetical protein